MTAVTVRQIVICEWCRDILDDGSRVDAEGKPIPSNLLAECPKDGCLKAAADADARLQLTLEAAAS